MFQRFRDSRIPLPQEKFYDWFDCLTQISAQEIIRREHFKLITLKEDDSIIEILDIFSRFGISSAPVLKSGCEESRQFVCNFYPKHPCQNFIGIVDLVDLVTLLNASFSPTFLTNCVANEELQNFLQKKAINLVELSGRNFWIQIPHYASAIRLIELLSHPNVHRVAVINDDGYLVGLVTQSMLIHFIHELTDDSRMKTKLEESFRRISTTRNGKDLCNTSVESMKWTHTVMNAFRLIWEKEVSGIAIVNDNDQLVANFDVRHLNKIEFHRGTEQLYQPVKSFLQLNSTEIHPSLESFPVDLTHSDIFYPLAVFIEEDIYYLKDLLRIVCSKKAHRIFIVDNNRHPKAIISLCDLIQCFLLGQCSGF